MVEGDILGQTQFVGLRNKWSLCMALPLTSVRLRSAQQHEACSNDIVALSQRFLPALLTRVPTETSKNIINTHKSKL